MSGLDLLGVDEDIVGFELDASKITVGVARALVNFGLRVHLKIINDASWTERAVSIVPGTAGSQSIYDKLKEDASHLQWHAENLRKFVDINALYPDAADLYKWARQAYVDAYAIEAARGAVDQAWADALAEIKSLPGRAVEALKAIPGAIVESVTGIPLWAWTIGGLTLLGLLGFGLYRLIRGAAPVALRVAEHRLTRGS